MVPIKTFKKGDPENSKNLDNFYGFMRFLSSEKIAKFIPDEDSYDFLDGAEPFVRRHNVKILDYKKVLDIYDTFSKREEYKNKYSNFAHLKGKVINYKNGKLYARDKEIVFKRNSASKEILYVTFSLAKKVQSEVTFEDVWKFLPNKITLEDEVNEIKIKDAYDKTIRKVFNEATSHDRREDVRPKLPSLEMDFPRRLFIVKNPIF